MTDLPPNVYRLPQRRFDAIPGAPWVYWVSDTVRNVFETLPRFGEIAQPRQGVATTDNFRFLRFWWEVGLGSIDFACRNRLDIQSRHSRWIPYVKGGLNLPWYGNLESAINWHHDGLEISHTEGAVIRNPDFYFREGLTFNRFGGARFAVRWLLPGYIFDCNGPSVIGDASEQVLAIANASLFSSFCRLLNPGVNFQVGDVERVPVIRNVATSLIKTAHSCVRNTKANETHGETSFDFVAPAFWNIGLADQVAAAIRLRKLERHIDEEVYRLYGIADADREAIEAELEGGALDHEDGEGDEDTKPEVREDGDEDATAGAMAQDELAVRWISYAVGVVLGRFQPGGAGALGRAVYRRDNFAIGSLPAPDEAEFDELVGPVERFAYVDGDGGRHVFSPQVEQALADLALPNGIAVLDEGHPRDLAALVEKALELMIDDLRFTIDRSLATSPIVNRQSEIVNQVGGDLRKFLEKDFFTRWHLRWYRKRPVYWPLQSAKRGYGFVLFHEKVEKFILYVLLRDYLDHKLNGLRLQIEDVAALAASQTGASRRQTERQLDRARQLLDEVNVFAQTIDRIAKGGYQPEPNWIDDGVILRLAPLWELIPIWKAEPKKTWERLEQGDYDWSHIAMAYWPERVAAACRVNKSFAIAHGLIDD